MTYRLYDFGPSPFCIKVRAVLDYKELAFERINVVGPAMLQLRRRGKIGKVPALEMADGRLVCDSTDIAYALEDAHPTPPVVPEEPRERALCHVLEDWADESLYWLGIYYRWMDPEGRKDVGRAFFGNPVIGGLLAGITGRTARAQLKCQGLGRKPPAQVEADLRRNLDQIETLLDGRDYLLGAAPFLCDFALCGQLVYLRRTPEGGRQLQGRPLAMGFMDRMKALRA